MKKILIASAVLAATGATVAYLLKRRTETVPVVDNKNHNVKPAKHLTEVFSKAKRFPHQHAMG